MLGGRYNLSCKNQYTILPADLFLFEQVPLHNILLFRTKEVDDIQNIPPNMPLHIFFHSFVSIPYAMSDRLFNGIDFFRACTVQLARIRQYPVNHTPVPWYLPIWHVLIAIIQKVLVQLFQNYFIYNLFHIQITFCWDM